MILSRSAPLSMLLTAMMFWYYFGVAIHDGSQFIHSGTIHSGTTFFGVRVNVVLAFIHSGTTLYGVTVVLALYLYLTEVNRDGTLVLYSSKTLMLLTATAWGHSTPHESWAPDAEEEKGRKQRRGNNEPEGEATLKRVACVRFPDANPDAPSRYFFVCF